MPEHKPNPEEGGASKSLFFPDEAINKHPRFGWVWLRLCLLGYSIWFGNSSQAYIGFRGYSRHTSAHTHSSPKLFPFCFLHPDLLCPFPSRPESPWLLSSTLITGSSQAWCCKHVYWEVSFPKLPPAPVITLYYSICCDQVRCVQHLSELRPSPCVL